MKKGNWLIFFVAQKCKISSDKSLMSAELAKADVAETFSASAKYTRIWSPDSFFFKKLFWANVCRKFAGKVNL